MERRCPDCGETKDVDADFGWRSQAGRRYPATYCRPCRSSRIRPDGSWIRVTEPRRQAPDGMRWCNRCDTDKPVADFGRRGSDGVAHWCRSCSAQYRREAIARMTPEQRAEFLRRKAASAAKYPESRKRNVLLRYFNLSLEDYEAMLASQGGVCAICRQPETATKRGTGLVQDLAVDHDHDCCPTKGKSCGRCIRGLLCARCNHALGSFRDDPEILRSALAYLDSSIARSDKAA